MAVQVDLDEMKKPYKMAKRYDWDGFHKFFGDNKDLLDKKIDLHNRIALHYAAHCGSPKMYKEMLEWVKKEDIQRVLRLQDDLGNTPLHEVAFTGEVEMTESILKYEEDPGSDQYENKLIEITNELGETAVYRAAALGKTELLCFFLEKHLVGVDPQIHFCRSKDNKSILHIAVIDQFFGTALWILERYEYLAYEKDVDKLTTLQLLAKMPSTFKSQTPMGPFRNFIYLLLPNFQDYKYYLQNLECTTKKEDVESGGNGKNKPSASQKNLEDNKREVQISKSHPEDKNEPLTNQRKLSVFSWMWYTIWKIMAKVLLNFQDYKYYLQNLECTTKKEDLESGGNGKNKPSASQKNLEDNKREVQISKSHPEDKNAPLTNQRKLSVFSWMWYTMWKIMAKEWREIDKLWRKKEMHNLAKKLVSLLAKKDYSWRDTAIAWDRTVSMGRSQPENKEGAEEQQIQHSTGKPTYTPLLMAACNGITEIVESIIRFHPHSIEHVNDDEQNILYMAVKHRQKKIYQILKNLKMVRSLAGKIDKESNTVLHYTAEFQGGSQPGYALQLQEELHWFDRIEKKLPYHYTVHKNSHNKTAKELFVEKHATLLKDAREWIKETAQSCSAVAALVATVVFAAAYTVPGGTDNDGFPRFLHHSIFLMFTIMDVVALVSSLASVIMFLSILTSPCEMWDFRKSLPRKLMTGFALLFFSMATTMLAFSATILINIKLKKNKWTSSLTYGAAFFPVCIFALVQFPLDVAIKGCVLSFPRLRKLKKIIPRFLLNLVKKKEKLWEE